MQKANKLIYDMGGIGMKCIPAQLKDRDMVKFINVPNSKGSFFISCCDCGLTHKVKFSIKDKQLDLSFIKNKGLTRRARKEKFNGAI